MNAEQRPMSEQGANQETGQSQGIDTSPQPEIAPDQTSSPTEASDVQTAQPSEFSAQPPTSDHPRTFANPFAQQSLQPAAAGGPSIDSIPAQPSDPKMDNRNMAVGTGMAPNSGAGVGAAGRSGRPGFFGRIGNMIRRHPAETVMAVSLATAVGSAGYVVTRGGSGEHQPGATDPVIVGGDRSPQPSEPIVINTPTPQTETPLPSMTVEPTNTASSSPDVTVTMTPSLAPTTEATQTPVQTASVEPPPTESTPQPGTEEYALQAIKDRLDPNNKTQFFQFWYSGGAADALGYETHDHPEGQYESSYELLASYQQPDGKLGVVLYFPHPKTGKPYVEIKQLGVPGAGVVFDITGDLINADAFDNNKLVSTDQAFQAINGLNESLVMTWSPVNSKNTQDAFAPTINSHMPATNAVHDMEVEISKGNNPAKLGPGTYTSVPDQLPSLDDVSFAIGLAVYHP